MFVAVASSRVKSLVIASQGSQSVNRILDFQMTDKTSCGVLGRTYTYTRMYKCITYAGNSRNIKDNKKGIEPKQTQSIQKGTNKFFQNSIQELYLQCRLP